jgi:hypothetical protein
MFIKKITKTDKTSKNQYVTFRLVQSFRLAGKPRHRNILDLGTLPDIPPDKHKALANRIEELLCNQTNLFPGPDNSIDQSAMLFYKKLLKKFDNKPSALSFIFGHTASGKEQQVPGEESSSACFHEVDLNTFDTNESMSIGTEWLCKQAIEEIDFSTLLNTDLGLSEKKYSLAMMALVGRLVYPGSDNKTADWLNENSGSGYLFGNEDKAITRKQISQISDELYLHKDAIEKYLINRFRDLFNYRPSLLVYDLTNTHFASRMQGSEKAKHGRNKQKRNDCPQITIALAIDEHGFAQHSRFYEGNIGETTTLLEIISDITQNIPNYKERFENKKPVIIMDAGIASEDNLVGVYNLGYDYLVVSRSEHNKVREQIDENQLVGFKNASGQDVYVKSFKNQLKYKDQDKEKRTIDETLLYVRTEEKKQKEDSIISNKSKKFEEELGHFQKSILNPKTNKAPEKIYERLGRLKERYRGVQFCYKIKVCHDNANNNLVTGISWEHIENNKKEQESGSYFIRTTITGKNDEGLWQVYHKITEVEAIFRILKSDLKARPVFHQLDGHIESHLFMCIVALQVVLYIRGKLKAKGINHSWQEILRIMQTQVYNNNTVKRRDGANVIIRTCTRPGIKAKEIYQALGYRQVPFYRKITIVENS